MLWSLAVSWFGPWPGRARARCTVIFGLLMAAAVLGAASPARGDTVQELLLQAGNADDAQCLTILKRLLDEPGLEPQLRADVQAMVATVDQWVTPGTLPYFGGSIGRDGNYDFKIARESPVYPLTSIYRGRMIVWYLLESGGLSKNRRDDLIAKARAEFRAASAAFPKNRIVRMYLGQPIPWAKEFAAVPGAPEWAVLQRECLERMADIIVWWIDHRMQPNGQYGGGWGDDCEMWRWWVPVLIGFADPKIGAAQTRFSNAVMSQPYMKAGYSSHVTDVEHSAEDSADVITPMMHLEPDNPLWKNRALYLSELMENLWTGRNERGMLQFKSTYFSCSRVDGQPQRACDTVYHPRAIQPTLLLWQRTGDPRLGRLFTSWLDTWVDAAARAERGKPAGIIPSAIHWPDGKIGGLGPEWWDPQNHGEATLYQWPSAMRMMVDSLLLAWHMTGDAKYLQPLRSMATIRLKWLKGSGKDSKAAGTPGSEAWCAQRLTLLAPTLAKYRRLSGSREFDELLARDYTGIDTLRPDGDRSSLLQALRGTARSLRYNFEGYTQEVRYTDRVIRFPSLLGKAAFAESPIPLEPPDTRLLYSTATGDPGDCGYFPLAAVRWLTPPRDIAALVTRAESRAFTAELLHFGPSERPMSAELFLLDPGRYELQVMGANADASRRPSQRIEVTGRRTKIQFTLPPRKLCTVRVRPRP